MEYILQTVLDLLDPDHGGSWNDANTSGVTPDFKPGWVNDSDTTPQVTVAGNDESPVDAGVTGFSAMDPTGAGAVQDIDGVVFCHTWATRDDGGSYNPRVLANEFADEIQRIVNNNQAPGDLQYLSYGGRQYVPPRDNDMHVWMHYQVLIGYGYESRP